MKKNNNKKGFTIVELVIVIAVIGILAAVLIPTFGSVIDNANESKALQEARNLYTEYLIVRNGQPSANDEFVSNNVVNIRITMNQTNYYYFQVTDGVIAPVESSNATAGTEWLTSINDQGVPQSVTIE